MEYPKIGIITSRGGHLFQMYQLKSWWKTYERFWVTFPGDDVSSMLRSEKVYFGYHPESRNIANAILNALLAIHILRRERPSLLISCGAAIAPPFFYVAKFMGIRTVFIEPYDFIAYPSLSGRLVAPIVDVLLVQHKKQLSFYRNAIFVGAVFKAKTIEV